MIQQTTWKRFGELLDNRFSKGVFTTEDSVRYTSFASVLECESLEPEDIILESPHPSRDRAEIDTWIPFISGDQVAIEFKYDREIPSGGNAPRTQKAGKIFHDIDRLGELGDGVRKVFVYLASAEMTRYFMKERNGLHSFFMLNVGESLRIDDRFMLGRSPTFIAAVGKTIDVDVDLIYTRNLSHGHAVRAYEVRAIEAIKKGSGNKEDNENAPERFQRDF